MVGKRQQPRSRICTCKCGPMGTPSRHGHQCSLTIIDEQGDRPNVGSGRDLNRSLCCASPVPRHVHITGFWSQLLWQGLLWQWGHSPKAPCSPCVGHTPEVMGWGEAVCPMTEGHLAQHSKRQAVLYSLGITRRGPPPSGL